MSLVAVTIIYISLLLVGTFFLTGAIVNRVVTSFEQKVSVSIFLKDGAAPADVQTLQADLQKDPRISGVSYVSKSQALYLRYVDPLALNLLTQGVDPGRD